MSRRPATPHPILPLRARRLAGGVGAVVVLSAVVLLAAALIPGSHARGPATAAAVRAVARARPGPVARVRETKVVGSRLSARRYAAVATGIENGIGSGGQYVSDLSPISWRRVLGPIARYKRYAERWSARLAASLLPLDVSLRAGDRPAAERDWTVAFDDYLRLGAVYGFIPARLDDALAEVPASTAIARFPGLHRIEKGLWTGSRLRPLIPVAAAVARAARRLRRTIPGLRVAAHDYILRGHEIMEDAQRDLLSGAQVPWSRQGVSATAAALDAERTVIRTLSPLLTGRDDTLGVTHFWLARMADALRRIRAAHHGYPPLGRLTSSERERLDATLAATCGALSAVPDTLELHATPSIPRDPAPR